MTNRQKNGQGVEDGPKDPVEGSLQGLDQVLDPRLTQQLEFILKIDQEKGVFRQTHLTGHGRRENDAEHAWHMAVMAYLLKEYADEDLDILHAIMLCLVHDLVEIEAGDTYAYDYEAQASQAAREEEAKQEIFSILPEDQARELMGFFDEFEANESPEARFAHAMDNLQPLLLNNSNGGGDWKNHRVSYEDVFNRQKKTRLSSERLYQLSKAVLDKHVKEGNLKKKERRVGNGKEGKTSDQ